MEKETKHFNELYELWMLGRVLSSKDRFLPTFSGWCVAIQTGQLADIEIEKTSLTYLPHIFDKSIRKTTLKIHDPITRNKTKLFKSAGKNVVLHHKNEEQVVEVNWDILGKLSAHPAKTQSN